MIEGSQLRADTPLPDALGKYRIVERIAAGGMAEIFLARAAGMLGFQKPVVIKRILPHLANRQDFVRMFLDEARIATTLNHPNVVQSFEVGVHGRNYFIAMEYLAGEDIRSIWRRLQKTGGRMPLPHVLDVVIGVAAGLHYAHEKKDDDGKPLQIVHRDVTPQNVIVTYDGGVKLLDFGIAKAENRINETRTGSFKGKVPYLSPEQCRGEPLDRRSDLFSLGVMLYELLVGKRLFRGGSDFQILTHIVQGEIPRPTQVDPSIDPRLEAIVMRALERDRTKRFQTARELQEALEEVAHQMRVRQSPLALSDYMKDLFTDRAEAWQQAAEQGDAAKLEEHVAHVAAEREVEIQIDVDEPEAAAPQLLPLPDPPSRSRAWMWAAAAVVIAAGAAAGWQLRPRSAPAAAAVAAGAAAPADDVVVEPVNGSDTGSVQVDSDPPGATVILDGKTVAQRTPARLAGVEPGREHLLVVKRAGYTQVAQRFTLGGGEEASFTVDLRRHAVTTPRAARVAPPVVRSKPVAEAAPTRPAPAAVPAGEGTLVVGSSPWCQVTVDGVVRGTTPVNLKLRSGSHTVVLANPEFSIKRTLSVDIEPNQTVRKMLDFAPEEK
jgi:eukaryotic-like serine/threonine-protein kinase